MAYSGFGLLRWHFSDWKNCIDPAWRKIKKINERAQVGFRKYQVPLSSRL
jgi:hypothetical protein